MATAQGISSDESHCVLCCDEMEYSACGSCDHPICLKCCVRLRLLRKEYDCPVCRAQLKEVIVSKGYKLWEGKSLKPRRQQHFRNYGIFHESTESQAKVDELLEHRCLECGEVFRSFPQVKEHIRRVHSKTYCDICLRNLKLFTHERKCYTREELVRHRKEGDPDDRSHRGHPPCNFCDDRYLDNDELLVHLRKNHFWCHLCEKDGSQDYYPHYKELRRHFKQSHFLCEEGECLHEKFTSVFRAKIDYQAHIAQKHSNRLTKAEARQLRQLDVNITFAPRETANVAGVVSSRDYSFPEEARGERLNRMTSGAASRDSDIPRETGRRKGNKDQLREVRSVPRNARSEEGDSKQYRQADVDQGVRDTKDRMGANKDKKSPRDVLEGDHKRPPGDVLQGEKDKKRILDNKSGKKSSNEVVNNAERSGKMGKVVKESKKADSKKNELTNETNFAGKEMKNNAGSSKTKVDQGSEVAQKLDKPKIPSNNEIQLDKKLEPSPEASTVVHTVSNVQDNFLSDNAAMKKPVKPSPKPMYESEFPSLSNKATAKPKASMKPPPGFAAAASACELVKEPQKHKNPSKTSTASEQDLMSKMAETANLEKAKTSVPNSKESVVKKPVPIPTYESEFPTLLNGHKPSSGVKAPPGFQPAVQPPPGLGWSVPFNIPSGSSNTRESRNQKLINDIRRILNLRGESFDMFREVSGCYRQGKSSPERYYHECRKLLGEEHIHKVFRELTALLPDEEKRRQLLLVYNDAKVKGREESEGDIGDSVNKSTSGRSISQPSLKDSDFPALPKASGKRSKSAGKVSNAWTRSGK